MRPTVLDCRPAPRERNLRKAACLLERPFDDDAQREMKPPLSAKGSLRLPWRMRIKKSMSDQQVRCLRPRKLSLNQ